MTQEYATSGHHVVQRRVLEMVRLGLRYGWSRAFLEDERRRILVDYPADRAYLDGVLDGAALAREAAAEGVAV